MRSTSRFAALHGRESAEVVPENPQCRLRRTSFGVALLAFSRADRGRGVGCASASSRGLSPPLVAVTVGARALRQIPGQGWFEA